MKHSVSLGILLLLSSVTCLHTGAGIPKDLGQPPGGNVPAEVTFEQSVERPETD